jgi:hypothetical protein
MHAVGLQLCKLMVQENPVDLAGLNKGCSAYAGTQVQSDLSLQPLKGTAKRAPAQPICHHPTASTPTSASHVLPSLQQATHQTKNPPYHNTVHGVAPLDTNICMHAEAAACTKLKRLLINVARPHTYNVQAAGHGETHVVTNW